MIDPTLPVTAPVASCGQPVDKDFFEELRELSTPENPCDYFVVAAFRDGKAGVFSTQTDPKLINAAFIWGADAVSKQPVETVDE